MKIENGVFTGTLDELLEYVFEHYAEELIKQQDSEIADVELPPNIDQLQKETWKKVCEKIKELERRE